MDEKLPKPEPVHHLTHRNCQRSVWVCSLWALRSHASADLQACCSQACSERQCGSWRRGGPPGARARCCRSYANQTGTSVCPPLLIRTDMPEGRSFIISLFLFFLSPSFSPSLSLSFSLLSLSLSISPAQSFSLSLSLVSPAAIFKGRVQTGGGGEKKSK